MDDREMLMLAAKAAGVEFHGWIDYPHANSMAASGDIVRNEGIWAPLTDDGDTLRLAVKLGIGTCYHQGWAQVMHPTFAERIDFDYGDDPTADVRRAIIRAAAEIGKAMTNG